MDLSDFRLKCVFAEAAQLADDLGVRADEIVQDALLHYTAELRHFAALRMVRRGEGVEVPDRCPLVFNLNPHSQWAPVEAWLRSDQRGPMPEESVPVPFEKSAAATARRTDELVDDLVAGRLSTAGARELYPLLQRKLEGASGGMTLAVRVLLGKVEGILSAA